MSARAKLAPCLRLEVGELGLILGPKGTGKSTLSAAMLPRRVVVAPMGASLPPGNPTFRVIPERWRVPHALALALRFMGQHRLDSLLIDDADTLYDLNAGALDHVAAHCRNWGIRLLVQGKTPARVGSFIRDSADVVIYRPGREAYYRKWGTDNGFPDVPLEPFVRNGVNTFYALRGEMCVVVNSGGALLRTVGAVGDGL